MSALAWREEMAQCAPLYATGPEPLYTWRYVNTIFLHVKSTPLL